MRRSLGLEPCSKGVSVVCEMSVGHTGSTCILLGSASNAAAAVSGTLGSYSVTQIICVASSKNATTLRARWRQAIADEGEYENQATSSKVAFQAFNMSDWLRPDDVIDIAKDVEGPLTALVNAATANIKQVAEGESGNNESMVELGQERKHAVLVHCDMGINRAPTVALAFLVQMGHTLRSAYFHVLQSRPGMDPLPPYRNGLRLFEIELHGISTVSSNEIFAMHISEILAVVGGEDVDKAISLRNDSISSLLSEFRN